MSKWIDLGNDVYVSFFTCPHLKPEMAGAIVRFGGDDDDPGFDHDDVCCGSIRWCSQCRGPTWTLHSLNPLHVEPSIRTTCHKHPEHHGFIRNGRWEPC